MAEPAMIWLNGDLVPAAQARLDPADRGVLLGDGLFETLRGANRAVLRPALHLARLRDGARRLGMKVPYDDETLIAALNAAMAANGLDDAALRLTLTRGPGPRGIAPVTVSTPSLWISAAAFIAAPPAVSAVICQSTRRNEFSPLAGIKSLNYLDSVLARQEAATRGADDAILLNTAGFIAEASAANLFLFSNGEWLTPRLEDGALPGITRQRLLRAGLLREQRITAAELFGGAAICLGNTLSLRQVTSLNFQKLKADAEAIGRLRKFLDAEEHG